VEVPYAIAINVVHSTAPIPLATEDGVGHTPKILVINTTHPLTTAAINTMTNPPILNPNQSSSLLPPTTTHTKRNHPTTTPPSSPV
jgi:hypothetical protein